MTTSVLMEFKLHPMRRRVWLVIRQWRVWLICIMGLGWPTIASAHGGGTLQLSNVDVGPYRIFAWSAPETPRVGDIHFSIALVDAAPTPDTPDQPVLDANVQVTLNSLDRPSEQFTQTGRNEETLLQYYYETDFTIPTAGRWRAFISVVGPEGAGDISFELEILPARRVNWTLLFWATLALLVGIGLYGRRSQRTEVVVR